MKEGTAYYYAIEMRRKIQRKKYRELFHKVYDQARKQSKGGAITATAVAAATALSIIPSTAQALPKEPSTTVRNNISSITSSGNIMNIAGSGNAFIRWQDFSIKLNETVNFTGMTNMLNYVPGSFKNPSLIYGAINAIGVDKFFIINPSGILFGPNSTVNTGNLFVSTRTLTDDMINNYINGGTNPLDTAIDASQIGQGLQSSEIMGAYDIADGDVMFLGKVQANSLTIEGNHIQIRNTANIMNKAGTAPLSGSSVTLISNNPAEIGYEVKLDAKYSDGTTVSDKAASTTVLEYPTTLPLLATDDYELLMKNYSVYLVTTGNDVIVREGMSQFEDLTYSQKQAIKTTLASAAQFGAFRDKINSEVADTLTTSLTGENKTKLMKIVLDKMIRDRISFEIIGSGHLIGDNGGVLRWNDMSDSTEYTKCLNEFKTTYANLESKITNIGASEDYKYFVADKLEKAGYPLPNSATGLGYNAKTLNRGNGSIRDYRLITSNEDFSRVNDSKYEMSNQLAQTPGRVHGNYMLNKDFDLSGVDFKSLGYNMNFYDYDSSDDLINFNGLNFTISNLTTNSEADRQGLFSTFAGDFKNLRLNNVNVGSSGNPNYAGGAIGAIGLNGTEHFDMTIKNVSVNSGNVNGNDVGGVVGNTGYGNKIYSEYSFTVVAGYPQVTFENIENFAVVSGEHSAGGVVGVKDHGNLIVNYSVNRGEVNSEGMNYEHWLESNSTGAGGIIGYTKDNFGTKNGNDSTTLNRVANFGNINAAYSAGGLLGGNYISSEEYTIQSGSNISILKSYNSGKVTATNWGHAGGIVGFFNGSSINQVFNLGMVNGSYAGGISGSVDSGSILNAYNSGTINGDIYGGGIVSEFNSSSSSVENAYNSASVTGNAYSGGLIGFFSNGTLKNSYSLGELNEVGGTSNWGTQTQTNVKSGTNINPSDVYSSWDIDVNGTKSSAIWRVYGNPNNPADSARQPLLTQFMSNATINRYHNAEENVEIDPLSLVNVGDDFGINILHDTSGNILSDRITYRSNAQTAPADYENAYKTKIKFDFIQGEDNSFKVSSTGTSMAAERAYSDQFGYNVLFNNNTTDWDMSGTQTNEVNNAYNTPDNNTIYLKIDKAAVVEPTEITATITVSNITTDKDGNFTVSGDGYTTSGGDLTGLDISSISITEDGQHTTITINGHEYTSTDNGKTYTWTDTDNNIKYTITVVNGNVTPTTVEATVTVGDVTLDSDGNPTSDAETTVTGNSDVIAFLKNALQTELTSDKKNTTIKDIKDNGDGTVSYTINGTTYKVTNNGDGTYTYTKTNSNNTKTYYKIKLVNGDVNAYVPTTTDVNVTINVNDGTIEDDTFTDNGYDVDNDVIKTLLSGELTVVKTSDEKNTTVTFSDNSKLKDNDDSTFTYTKGGTTYNFTKNSNGTYTYSVKDSSGNITNYNITINMGDITKTSTLNIYDITIEVSDGVFDKNTKTLTLDNSDGYTVKNISGVDISNFKIEHINGDENGVGGTDILNEGDTTFSSMIQITYNGAVYSVANNNLTKNSDGTYTLKITSGKTLYNFTIDPGKIVSSDQIPVTLTVNDGTIVDGKLSTNGYSVSNTFINGLLNGEIKVVATEDGKSTTIQVADSSKLITNSDGSYTYTKSNGTTYNFKKNTDGTYTYTVTATNGEKSYYNVTIVPGDITTTNNITIEVSDGVFDKNTKTLTLDNATGYTLNNTGGVDLSNFKIEHINGDENGVGGTDILNEGDTTFSSMIQITYNGAVYSVANNNLTKNSDGTYTLKITSGKTLYNFTIDPGKIVSSDQIPVTLTVNDGTIVDGKLSTNGYSVSNTFINGLLNGEIKVVATEDGKSTTIQVADSSKLITNSDGSYTYTKSNGTTYNFKKNTDGTYTYTVTATNGEKSFYNVTIVPGDITTTNNITISVSDGTYDKNTKTVTPDSTNWYTTNNSGIDLSKFKIEHIDGDINSTNGTDVINDGDTTYSSMIQITYKGKTYSAHNGGLTKNSDGTYTLNITDGSNIYNFTIDPGKIVSDENIPVILTVNDGDVKNGTLITNGYSVNNTFINGLLKGEIKVVATENGKNTTIQVADSSKLVTNSDGSYTYTKSNGTTYNFKKNTDGTYTYTVTATNGEKSYYNVTIVPGDITETNNITISVSDGIFDKNTYTVTPTGNSWYTANSGGIDLSDFKIEHIDGDSTGKGGSDVQNAGDTTFTSMIQITYKGKVYSVSNGGITKNSDGNYVVNIKDGSTTYIFTIDPGTIVSDEDIPVTLTVNDGTMRDGTLTSNGYSVNNTFINRLLDGEIKVVATADGKNTTIQVADSSRLVTNSNGSYTYTKKDGTKYTFTKNSNGTYTYTFTATNGEESHYNVRIVPGDITSYLTSTVVITVGDGTIDSSGNFTNTGYTIDNPIIARLLGNLTVVPTSNNRRTTVVIDNSSLTNNGDGTYTYTSTDSDGNVTTYIITIDLGNITTLSDPTPIIQPTDNSTTNIEKIEEIRPAVDTNNLTNIEENDTDYTLKNSNIQSFSREKGDYIDLDLQDHTLEDRTDVEESIDVLSSSPDEFIEATSRNQVDGTVELSTINDNEEQPPSSDNSSSDSASSTAPSGDLEEENDQDSEA